MIGCERTTENKVTKIYSNHDKLWIQILIYPGLAWILLLQLTRELGVFSGGKSNFREGEKKQMKKKSYFGYLTVSSLSLRYFSLSLISAACSNFISFAAWRMSASSC